MAGGRAPRDVAARRAEARPPHAPRGHPHDLRPAGCPSREDTRSTSSLRRDAVVLPHLCMSFGSPRGYATLVSRFRQFDSFIRPGRGGQRPEPNNVNRRGFETLPNIPLPPCELLVDCTETSGGAISLVSASGSDSIGSVAPVRPLCRK